MPIRSGPWKFDDAFRYAGQIESLQIWRVEKMKLQSIPREEHGKFYEGDSYLILKTFGVPPNKWIIHMWIGTKSSVDEQFVAAYKSLELEEVLSRSVTQYRETQFHESSQFLSYFENGIRYMTGGMSSGLRHRTNVRNEESRLFKVKGKFNCRTIEVPLSIQSLNKGDAFLLITSKKIFVWNGPNCSYGEKIKAAEVARVFRDERPKTQVIVIDEDWNTNRDFFMQFGAKPENAARQIPEDDGTDDEEFEKRHDVQRMKKMKLFRISDASGRISVTEVKGTLSKDSLNTNDCFFLDLDSAGIYAWIGNECTEQERKNVWVYAKSYFETRNLPRHVPIVKVNEGNEPAIMKLALNWPPDHPHRADFLDSAGVAKINPSEHPIDYKSLHTPKTVSTGEKIDNGLGAVQVNRVVKFSLEEIPRQNHGIFYSGDSYVILYDSVEGSKKIIYYWLGLTSSADEKTAAAFFTTTFNRQKYAYHAKQIRINQMHETEHFLSIFNGFIIILFGGAASGFRKREKDVSWNPEERTCLLQVRNCRAAEVSAQANSLNSNDVFILCCRNKCYMWIGKGSTKKEKIVAHKCLQRLHIVSSIEIREGEETDDFWSQLGGKAEYATGGTLNMPVRETARLFHCSNARGYFYVEEISNFSQADLIPDDVMLLDTFREIFIWIGDGANFVEQKEGLKLATKYLEYDPCNRSPANTAMLTVRQGYEPYNFRAHFPAWDPSYWKCQPSYEDIKRKLTRSDGQQPKKISTVQETSAKFQATHPVEVLRRRAEDLPVGVDPTKKEDHLSDADFRALFGYSRAEFEHLKPWKKLDEKRRVGLY